MKIAKDQFIGMVSVGDRGEIIIPEAVREMFALRPSGSLLILADRKKGIALRRGTA